LRRAARTVLIAVLLLGAACSGDGAGLSRLGRCDVREIDGAPASSTLAAPGAWLRVLRIDLASGRRPGASFRGGYEVVGGDAAPVAALAGPVDALRMHDSIARDVAAALRVTPEVYVHTLARSAREVGWAVALTDRDVTFLGRCADRLLTRPVRSRFGAAAPATVRGWVGSTGAEVAAAYPDPGAPPPAGPVLRAPAGLAAVRLAVAPLPASWRGPYALCLHVAQGWTGCVDLAAPRDAGAYADPALPRMQFWLARRSGGLVHPLARLGAYALDGLGAGVRIVVTLPATPSLRAVLAKPRAFGGNVAQVTLTRP
jgi:hypothetical protein